MRLHLRLLYSLACLSCWSAAARSDVAPDPMGGGISLAVPGGGQTEIALLHNTVRLKVSPRLCQTRAFFRLRNMGQATGLEVGFPLAYQGEAKDFQLFIDGTRAAFEDKSQEVTTPIGQKHTRWWKVWPMKFEAGQEHLVEARYSNVLSLGYSFGITDLAYDSVRRVRETGGDYNLGDFGHEKRVELHEWIDIKRVEYILVTGSYWKGPIERCRVEARVEGVELDSIVEVSPAAQSFSPRRIVWEWKNAEPARNIVLAFVAAPPRQSIPYIEKIAAQHPEDETLQRTLRSIKQDFSSEKIKARRGTFRQPREALIP